MKKFCLTANGELNQRTGHFQQFFLSANADANLALRPLLFFKPFVFFYTVHFPRLEQKEENYSKWCRWRSFKLPGLAMGPMWLLKTKLSGTDSEKQWAKPRLWQIPVPVPLGRHTAINRNFASLAGKCIIAGRIPLVWEQNIGMLCFLCDLLWRGQQFKGATGDNWRCPKIWREGCKSAQHGLSRTENQIIWSWCVSFKLKLHPRSIPGSLWRHLLLN